MFCVSLALAACGGESSSSATQSGDSLTEVTGTPSPPKIEVPPGPPPKELVVKDLTVGSGAVAKWGKRLSVQYIDASYGNGKTYEVVWNGVGKGEPFSFVLGAGSVNKGWEIGLKGMKVGGRRELRVPERLSYTGPKVYIVELVGIET